MTKKLCYFYISYFSIIFTVIFNCITIYITHCFLFFLPISLFPKVYTPKSTNFIQNKTLTVSPEELVQDYFDPFHLITIMHKKKKKLAHLICF